MVDRIKQVQHGLTRAERRVAQLVLEHPRKILGEPIAAIAQLSQVSQPTVIRVCRSLGFSGLVDFKHNLASSMTGTIQVRHSEVLLADSTLELLTKIVDNTVAELIAFRDQLDVRSIERAIALLRSASRVDFYSTVSVNVMASDRVLSLHGSDNTARMYQDPTQFRSSAERLGRGDVVVAIAAAGPQPELQSAVEFALARGVVVIAVADGQSTLAGSASLCLPVRQDHGGTLSTLDRISQLLMIDVLLAGMARVGPRGNASD